MSFGTAELIKEIRRLVRSRLPDYMLPARFVVLETIPRRPNGRVDYAALPAPTEADSIFEDYVAPRNKTEEILAGIWQELLKLDKVSVKDSFFDLGGQSLLAVRLFNRIENEFGRRFPLAMLFRAPTIDQLARKLTADDGHGVGVAFSGSDPAPGIQSAAFSRSWCGGKRAALQGSGQAAGA